MELIEKVIGAKRIKEQEDEVEYVLIGAGIYFTYLIEYNSRQPRKQNLLMQHYNGDPTKPYDCNYKFLN